jgi:DNA polymerase-3 subunit delta
MAKPANKSVKALDLLKELKSIYTEGARSKLSPVYVIHGEEVFIRERALQRLKQIAAKLNAGMDRVTFDNKMDMAEFINNLNEVSMFNPFKFVVASEFSDLKDEQVQKLIEYLENPSQDVVLTLLSYKIDKRKKKLTNIFNYGVVCEGKHPKGDEVSMWINGFAGERGKTIEHQAVEFLKAKYDGDLSRIEKEIEKTSLFIGSKKDITVRDIEFTATGVSSCSVFDISPVLATKNKKQVLEKVQKLLDAGESPILINSAVMGRIKRLLLGHDILLSKAGDAELAKAVGVPPFFLTDFKRELRNYKREELVCMYRRCMNIDAELKNSKRDKDYVLVCGMLDLLARR